MKLPEKRRSLTGRDEAAKDFHVHVLARPQLDRKVRVRQVLTRGEAVGAAANPPDHRTTHVDGFTSIDL